MGKQWVSGALAALALGVSGPALAGVSQDFSGCDGLKKPKSSDDGMRGEATFPAYGFSNDSAPRMRLAACNRALEGKSLRPEQTLRRAHLLRARAAAKIELGDATGALADLDAAQLVAAPYAGEFFYDRSMGVSIDLLRAIALNQSGQTEAALALAEQAAAKRPFSLEIQRVAVLLRSLAGDRSSDRTIWQGLARIDPMTRSLADELASRPANIVDLAIPGEVPALVFPEGRTEINVLGRSVTFPTINKDWQAAVRQALTKAYAFAAKGQPDEARAWVDMTKAALDEAEATPVVGNNGEKVPRDDSTDRMLAMMARVTQFDPMVKLIDARIAVSGGRLPEAAAALEGLELRSAPLTEELYAAYAAARVGDTDAPELAPLSPAPKVGSSRVANLASTLLIRPESKRKLIDYEQSRPDILGAMIGAAFSFGTTLLGGVERTAGFRSTPNGDGSIKVEFTGNTTSAPVVQEMTLLRAAEIAREAGKSHFHIASRSDYQRMLTRSMGGTPLDQTLVGYKTELTIRLLDDSASEPDALDAVAVIDALGPIYYGA